MFGFDGMRSVDPWGMQRDPYGYGYGYGHPYDPRPRATMRHPYGYAAQEDPYYHDGYAGRAPLRGRGRRNNPWYEEEMEEEPQYYQPYPQMKQPASLRRHSDPADEACDCTQCQQKAMQLQKQHRQRVAARQSETDVASDPAPKSNTSSGKKLKLKINTPGTDNASVSPSKNRKKREAPMEQPEKSKVTATPFRFPSPSKLGPILSARGSCVLEDVDDADSNESGASSLTLPRNHPYILEMVDTV